VHSSLCFWFLTFVDLFLLFTWHSYKKADQYASTKNYNNDVVLVDGKSLGEDVKVSCAEVKDLHPVRILGTSDSMNELQGREGGKHMKP